MKKTTCRNLKGACEVEIVGSTPEEMGDNSHKHVMEMVQQGEEAHMHAMEGMKKMSPEEQHNWYEDFKERFPTLPSA